MNIKEVEAFFNNYTIPRTQLSQSELLPVSNFSVERFDLVHPLLQGNKWFKLKRNIFWCVEGGNDTILTFGGAFSNHIHATAAAGKILGLKTIGVIRGERPFQLNYTLRDAESFGMELVFVSREEYRRRYNPDYVDELRERLGHFFCVAEGGSNRLGYLGAREMLPADADQFDYIMMPMGSGGTLGGNLIAAASRG
jgi:1-aminocyclopropane-1-carboxylate deaminase